MAKNQTGRYLFREGNTMLKLIIGVFVICTWAHAEYDESRYYHQGYQDDYGFIDLHRDYQSGLVFGVERTPYGTYLKTRYGVDHRYNAMTPQGQTLAEGNIQFQGDRDRYLTPEHSTEANIRSYRELDKSTVGFYDDLAGLHSKVKQAIVVIEAAPHLSPQQREELIRQVISKYENAQRMKERVKELNP
jgi:hypothetical protein